jgi:hypothetical protein
MINREGHDVNLYQIDKVEDYDDSIVITHDQGMSLMIDKWELDGFVPQVGDTLVLTTRNLSFVLGIIIEGRVIRRKNEAQFQKEHQQMIDGFRLRRLEDYVKNGDKLKARVERLLPPLRDRMHRFAKENGTEFWIEDAGYEMAALEGANALLVKTEALGTEDAIQWINDWWDLDYKKQLELVPDFGEDHSGFTASSAKGLAIAVLEGKEI